MKSSRFTARSFLLTCAVLLPASALFSGDEAKPASAGDLEEVQRVRQDFLKSTASVSLSRDGKFLYAAAYRSNAVSVFKRDAETGRIESDSWMELPELEGAVGVQVSPDDEFAAVCAFGVSALSLFKRDKETGELIFLDAAIEGKDGATGLRVAVDLIFSADSRFLYSGSVTGIGIFRIEKDKLVFVREENAGGRLKDVRGFAVSPDGSYLYAAANESGAAGVFRRDKKSGELEQVQVLVDGEEGTNALAGAFRIACSRDGRHVYISSGRLQGDQAISVFETQPDGKLKLVEEHVNGTGDLTGFKGGNGIAISPDGTLVYAAATVSDRLVRFRRDPLSGKLTFLGSQSVGAFTSPGACALAFSPDGKFVYVADEDSNSIVVFKQP